MAMFTYSNDHFPSCGSLIPWNTYKIIIARNSPPHKNDISKFLLYFSHFLVHLANPTQLKLHTVYLLQILPLLKMELKLRMWAVILIPTPSNWPNDRDNTWWIWKLSFRAVLQFPQTLQTFLPLLGFLFLNYAFTFHYCPFFPGIWGTPLTICTLQFGHICTCMLSLFFYKHMHSNTHTNNDPWVVKA
jgi:hypothetical protein